MKIIPPNITPGPWGYCYTSAAQARKDHPGTDGGGASGSVYDKADQKNRHDRKTIIYLPHHREVAEDTEREANARAIAATPDTLRVLAGLAQGFVNREVVRRHGEKPADMTDSEFVRLISADVWDYAFLKNARAALIKAGYTFEE